MLIRYIAPLAFVATVAVAPAMAGQSDQVRESGADPYGKTASGEAARSAPSFDQLDRNQDGKLDEDELNAWGSTAAGGSDADREAVRKRSEQMLEKFDHDDDDAISKDELNAEPEDAGSARGSNL